MQGRGRARTCTWVLRWSDGTSPSFYTDSCPHLLPCLPCLPSSLPPSLSAFLLARLAYHPGPVIAQYQAEVSRRAHLFEGQSLTTAMWGMAALSVSECERVRGTSEMRVRCVSAKEGSRGQQGAGWCCAAVCCQDI